MPPEEAIRRARELYHHAQQLQPTSAKAEVMKALHKLAKPYLTLKPAKRNDAVRRYLKKHKLPLTTARSVMETRYLMDYEVAAIAKCLKVSVGWLFGEAR